MVRLPGSLERPKFHIVIYIFNLRQYSDFLSALNVASSQDDEPDLTTRSCMSLPLIGREMRANLLFWASHKLNSTLKFPGKLPQMAKKAAKKKTTKKTKAPKATKKKATKRKSRSKKATAEARKRLVWGVFSSSMKEEARFPYDQRKEAEKKLEQLSAKSKKPFFIQPMKELISESAPVPKKAAEEEE